MLQRYLFLSFPFFAVFFFGIFKKGLRKTVLRNRSFAPACIISKYRRPLSKRIVLQILFRISQSNSKEGNPWNPDLDLLIEFHSEDGFLESEIHCWVLRSIAKFEILFTKSKSGFANQLQQNCNCSGYLHRGSICF